MDENTFWNLIDETFQASNGDPKKQCELLDEQVKEYSLEEILEFDHICQKLLDGAYLADLWDAAYIIGCGCSDDGFMDFRAWLIQQGRKVYETALKDPETLADIVEDGFAPRGCIWGVSISAYEAKTT